MYRVVWTLVVGLVIQCKCEAHSSLNPLRKHWHDVAPFDPDLISTNR